VTTRTVDWSVVWTDSSDPIPGSPDGVANGAAEYQGNARAIRSAINYIDALDLSDLSSDAVAKVVDQMKTVRGELDKVEERVLGVGNALAGYVESFRSYQNQTMSLWSQADSLQTQKESAAANATGLRGHAHRMGDSDEADQLEEDAKKLDAKAAGLDSQLASVRSKFRTVVDNRNQTASQLKATLDALDQYTPGKDSFWDKVQSWVQGVVSAIFTKVMAFIKAAVDLILKNLRLVLLALVAVLILTGSFVTLGFLALAGAAVFAFLIGTTIGEYLANPDVAFAMLKAAAGGALIYMAIAAARQLARPPFKPCDQDTATLTSNRELLQCADAAYKTGAEEQGKLPEGYRSLSSEEMDRLGVTQAMLVDEASGYKASVYYKEPGGPYVVAFAGSDFDSDGRDAVNDLAGAHGTTKQDLLAIQLARQVSSSGEGVVFTGHSLGGRQASLAAIATGAPAVTFNPAGTSASAISYALYARDGNDTVAAAAHLSEAASAVTVYRTEGDLLSNLQEGLDPLAPPAFGDNRYTVHDPTGGDPVHQHSQGSLFEAFDQEIHEARSEVPAGSGGW